MPSLKNYSVADCAYYLTQKIRKLKEIKAELIGLGAGTNYFSAEDMRKEMVVMRQILDILRTLLDIKRLDSDVDKEIYLNALLN